MGRWGNSPMITVSNQACFTKTCGCRLQEVVLRKGDEDFTYKSLRTTIFRNRRLRIEREDNALRDLTGKLTAYSGKKFN